jgi:hypothetical protein
MQSTGQGGRQSLQPMHQRAITACINPFAPLIASTGQASMQRVQPMQRASSILATWLRFTLRLDRRARLHARIRR